ncbi:MAG: alkaline shock response membrane anchor protein AmaP [Symbiobacteriia bacterium]
MGILGRIVLLLYTLSLAVISAVVLGMSTLGWLAPLDWVRTSLTLDPNGRWSVGLASALFFVVSIVFIVYTFTPRYPSRTLVHETELGEVHVTLDAIENLVKKVTRQIRGVRGVKARVSTGGGGLNIWLKTVVSPDVSVPAVSEEIRATLKSYVKNVVGAEVAEVHVYVTDISSEARKGRVD